MSEPQPLLQPSRRSVFHRCQFEEDSPFRVWNVRLFFGIVITVLIIWSFSFGATFDAYLLELARAQNQENPNTFVGKVESVRGITTLVLALPLGWLSDTMNRRSLLKWNSCFGTLALSFAAMGIALDVVWLIYAGVVMSALFMQVLMTCGKAFLADSVEKDKLQAVTAAATSMYLLGYSMGPVAQAILISKIGDTWNLRELHWFLCSGFFLWPFVMPAFFFFEKSLVEVRAEQAAERGVNQDAENAASHCADSSIQSDGPAPSNQSDRWYDQRAIGMKKKWLVPALLEACGLITAIGAGMTVKFFPLFFKEDYGFKPVALNSLQATYCVAIAVCVMVCRQVSKRMGPMQAAFIWHVCGTLFLYGFWLAQPVVLVMILYILRGGVMNAIGPINEALIMECVPSKYRGRWSAIQSFSRMSWSGSAILGGVLADSHDYRYTFLITALVYSFSALFYIPLINLVPSQRESQPELLAHPTSSTGDGKGSSVSLQNVAGDTLDDGAMQRGSHGPKRRISDGQVVSPPRHGSEPTGLGVDVASGAASNSAGIADARVEDTSVPAPIAPGFSGRTPMPFGYVGTHIKLSNEGCLATRFDGVTRGTCFSREPLIPNEQGFYYEVLIESRGKGPRAPAMGFGLKPTAEDLVPTGALKCDDAMHMRHIWVVGYDRGGAQFHSNGSTTKVSPEKWRPVKDLQDGSTVGVWWATKPPESRDPPELVIFQDGIQRVRLPLIGRLPDKGEELFAVVDLQGCFSQAMLLKAKAPPPQLTQSLSRLSAA